MLPTDFTKQDAVKQAEVLGIGNKTIDGCKNLPTPVIFRILHTVNT